MAEPHFEDQVLNLGHDFLSFLGDSDVHVHDRLVTLMRPDRSAVAAYSHVALLAKEAQGLAMNGTLTEGLASARTLTRRPLVRVSWCAKHVLSRSRQVLHDVACTEPFFAHTTEQQCFVIFPLSPALVLAKAAIAIFRSST